MAGPCDAGDHGLSARSAGIDALIEASSLGTSTARRFREKTSRGSAAELVARAFSSDINEKEPSSRRPGANRRRFAEFDEFCSEVVKILVDYLIRIGASKPDAEQYAQEILASSYLRWDRIADPWSWVFQEAARMVDPGRIAKGSNDIDPPLGCGDLERSRFPVGVEVSHLSSLSLKESLNRVGGSIPDRQRQVLARILSGYTPAEAARDLEVPVNSVRSALENGIRRLLGIYDDEP